MVQKLNKSRPAFGPKIEQKQHCFWSNMTSWKEFMGLKQACFWSKNQAKAALLLVHFYKQKQYCFWSYMTSGKQFMGLKQACFWSIGSNTSSSQSSLRLKPHSSPSPSRLSWWVRPVLSACWSSSYQNSTSRESSLRSRMLEELKTPLQVCSQLSSVLPRIRWSSGGPTDTATRNSMTSRLS